MYMQIVQSKYRQETETDNVKKEKGEEFVSGRLTSLKHFPAADFKTLLQYHIVFTLAPTPQRISLLNNCSSPQSASQRCIHPILLLLCGSNPTSFSVLTTLWSHCDQSDFTFYLHYCDLRTKPGLGILKAG